MSRVKSGRFPDGLADWLEEFASAEGVKENAVLVEAVEQLRARKEAGPVPPSPEVSPRPQSSDGVGVCPARADGKGHVWVSWKVDPQKPCKFCGKPGRENFQEVTAARSSLFATLRQPDSVKGVRKSGGGS